MKKRLLMIMLASVMAFSSVACSSVADEKTRVSREAEDDDEDDDEDNDDESDKKSKKDKKDKKDKSDKKDKDKSKKQKDKEIDEEIDEEIDDSAHVDNQTGYFTVDDDAVGADFTIDEEYISDAHYDAETGELDLCDYDGNHIITLYVPDGYVVTYASEQGACFDLNNEKQYFDQISVDYREDTYIANYIRDGKEPGGTIEDYSVSYDEYEVDGLEFIVAHEEYYDSNWDDDFSYDYILVPYKSGKTTEYVSICTYWNKSASEMRDLAHDILGIE